MPCYADPAAWPRRPADLPATPLPCGALLGDPAAFRIKEIMNPLMLDERGGLLRADPEKARLQWQGLAGTLRALGLDVEVLPSHPDLPDLCFTANPSLSLPFPEGGSVFWMARMTFPARRGEVAHHRRFAERRGLPVRSMPPEVARFEGGGDGVPHPGRFLLHAGVGPRSEEAAWRALAAGHPGLDVLLYRLADPRFYHLDTALAALNERTALFVAGAFFPEGRALLEAAFADLIEVPPEEALRLAANAWCPDSRNVLLPAGCPRTEAALRVRGFRPLPLETGEFLKSGGSVYCLKQPLYPREPAFPRDSSPGRPGG